MRFGLDTDMTFAILNLEAAFLTDGDIVESECISSLFGGFGDTTTLGIAGKGEVDLGGPVVVVLEGAVDGENEVEG